MQPCAVGRHEAGDPRWRPHGGARTIARGGVDAAAGAAAQESEASPEAPVVMKVKELFARLVGRRPEGAGGGAADLYELSCLRPFLSALPANLRTALDVGANVGSVTRALAGWGFTVYALEPHPDTSRRLRHELRELIATGRVRVLEIAASDHDGEAEMFVGSADTLSTLEADWTRVAFPEYFGDRRKVRVATRRLSALLDEAGIKDLGFVKIDTEGHDLSVLRGLFSDGPRANTPAALMFEANQRFPEAAEECLALLAANGYAPFDIFIKEGPELLAAARFEGARLPPEWRRYGGKYFYANVIAYAARLPEGVALPEMRPPA